jgi:hypothetical protein
MQLCRPRLTSARPFAALLVLILFGELCAQAPEQSTGKSENSRIARTLGTIKSIHAESILIVADSGGERSAQLGSSTRILRVSPGEKDLKNATPLKLEDLESGDRVLIRGEASADGRSIAALAVIVMKEAEISAKQEREREEWQRRGVGGLVSAVNPASGTATISVGGMGRVRSLIIHSTQDTVVRRYAADSVKFDDARPARFDQIKTGDQLRARGPHAEDGSELTAGEIVFGTFRNIAGTITAVDAAANSLTVEDAISKSAVAVKVAPDSQMKKLPPQMAQRIAMRLKDLANESGDQQPGGRSFRTPAAARDGLSQMPRRPESGMEGGQGNGAPDFQRLLSRLPSSTLSDLRKGDTVMVVATMATESGTVTAITLLAGVESIMMAAPSRSVSLMLSPWTLGPSSAESGGAEP